MDLNCSPVTSMQLCSDCPDGLVALLSAMHSKNTPADLSTKVTYALCMSVCHSCIVHVRLSLMHCGSACPPVTHALCMSACHSCIMCVLLSLMHCACSPVIHTLCLSPCHSCIVRVCLSLMRCACLPVVHALWQCMFVCHSRSVGVHVHLSLIHFPCSSNCVFCCWCSFVLTCECRTL